MEIREAVLCHYKFSPTPVKIPRGLVFGGISQTLK
jgi:hypothetical protein